MRVLILSLSRCASTAIYYDVLRRMPGQCEGYFEPDIATIITKPLAQDIVAKIILDELDTADLGRLIASFDKVLLSIRDPRDRLVSSMLFAMHGVEKMILEQRLAELELKQKQPEVYPFLALVEKIYPGWTSEHTRHLVQRDFALLGAVLKGEHRIDIIYYEDYIQKGLIGVFEDDEKHLQAGLELPKKHAYGKRKITSGDWKNWFTPSDVEFFKPLMAGFIRQYGYEDDWQLNKTPVILPEHGSQFVLAAYEHDLRLQKQGITWKRS